MSELTISDTVMQIVQARYSPENHFTALVLNLLEGIVAKHQERYDELLLAHIQSKVDQTKLKPPPEIRVAMRILLNHIENPKEWANCRTVVEQWLDATAPNK